MSKSVIVLIVLMGLAGVIVILAFTTQQDRSSIITQAGNASPTEGELSDVTLLRSDLRPTPAQTSFTLVVGLFDLRVQVRGAAGQGLAFATVVVKGPTVPGGSKVLTASPDGFAEFPALPDAGYDVEASYKGFRGEARVSAEELRVGRVVGIELPPYIEVGGIVFTFNMFLAAIIASILLIISIVVLLDEYIEWRRRRLGPLIPLPTKK